MTSPPQTGIRPQVRRRWRVAAAVVGVLALLGAIGGKWYHDDAERSHALELAGRNRFDEAEPLLLRVHGRGPRDVEVVRALALAYLESRLQEGAEIYLDRWCELQPAEPEPFRRRLNLRTNQQKVAESIADAKHILQLRPDDFPTRRMLVQLLLLDGRYEQAEHEGLLCYRAYPKDRELWFLLASIYQGRKQSGVAGDLLDQILRVEPNNLPALKLRARIYLEAGRADEAVRLLEQVVRQSSSPDGAEGLHELSVALTRAGRVEEAREVVARMQWRRALALWSADERRDNNLGLQERVVETMLAAGKTDDAVRFLREILERNPQAPPGTRQLLAECIGKKGQPERDTVERRRSEEKPIEGGTKGKKDKESK